MNIARFAIMFSSLAFAVGCGGAGLGRNSGGGGANSPSATVSISNTTGGPFRVAMSTSFQPAEWDYPFFSLNPSATTTLGNLGSNHIRPQGISRGIPQGSEGTTSTTWDFSTVDAVTQPILGIGDHSPEFQIAKAPAFMYVNDDSNSAFADPTFTQFAAYSQNLVEYYNAGGFTANTQTYLSPSYPTRKITWWGIYNEPNINHGLSPADYVALYNQVVPAMQAIDPTIKFAALELADFSGQEAAWVPPFVRGVTGARRCDGDPFLLDLRPDRQGYNCVRNDSGIRGGGAGILRKHGHQPGTGGGACLGDGE
jgi:hypothetical protein